MRALFLPLATPPRPSPLQVPGDQELADLLSALEEGSTAATGGLYAAALPQADSGAPADLGEQQGAAPGGGKVRAVCEAVRAAVQARDPVSALGTVWAAGRAPAQLPVPLSTRH